MAEKKDVLSWKLVLLIGGVIVAVTVAAMVSMGNPFRPADVTLKVPTLGQPAKTAMPLAAGARLTFAVYAEEATIRSPHDALLLHIELLKGDTLAVATKCVGIDGGPDKASQPEGVTFGPAGCPLTVPDSGVDAIQVTANWKGGGEGISLTGVAIKVFVDTE